MVAQAHGGALLSTFTPEARSKGGQVAAERRRARAERNEEIDDARFWARQLRWKLRTVFPLVRWGVGSWCRRLMVGR